MNEGQTHEVGKWGALLMGVQGLLLMGVQELLLCLLSVVSRSM